MASKPIHLSLNALDHLPPANYANCILYFPLKAGISSHSVFDLLQRGLHRTFIQIPWLSGKIFPVPHTQPRVIEIQYFHPVHADETRPYQLKFNDLDPSGGTYEDLQESAFHPTAFEDQALTWASFLPDLAQGAEVFVAQANFLPGGCILTAAVNHAAADGAGLFSMLKIWADNCTDVQTGNEDLRQVTQPLEISDRDLLERIWVEKGSGRSALQMPPETWKLLGLEAPGFVKPSWAIDGQQRKQAPTRGSSSPRCDMKSYVFYLSAVNVAALREECSKETGTTHLSTNDVISALIWQCLLRSRTAAKKASLAVDGGYSAPHADSEDARLDLPFDVRPYFSQSVPANYLGNFTMINQVSMPLSRLIAPSTTFGSVASTIRKVAGEVTTTSLMDAYSLVKTVRTGLTLDNLRADGTGLIITSLLAIPMAAVSFGGGLFANDGKPETMRMLMGAINKVFRYCVILPRKSHGGVEFVANMFEKEMELLMEDEEFRKYALFVT